MAFQVSPGVAVAEIDLTTRVPIPSISDGAIAGNLTWGPLEQATLITSEDELVAVFGKPNGNTYKTFWSAANFLSYSNKLRVVRAANTTTAKNAVTGGSAILIRNDREYENTYMSTTTSGTSFTAKHPGVLGNSMKISVCLADRCSTQVNSGVVTHASSTDLTLTGTWTADASSTTVTGVGSLADTELRIGDAIVHGSNTGVVTSITSNTEITVAQGTGGLETTGLGGTTAISGTVYFTRKKRSAFEEPADNMLGTIGVLAGNTTVTGTNTNFTRQLHVGDILTIPALSLIHI